jgi:hypothetical protein
LCTVNAVGGPVATATSATAISNALSRDTGITVTTLPVVGTGTTTSITAGALNDLLRPLGLDLTSLFINALIQAVSGPLICRCSLSDTVVARSCPCQWDQQRLRQLPY